MVVWLLDHIQQCSGMTLGGLGGYMGYWGLSPGLSCARQVGALPSVLSLWPLRLGFAKALLGWVICGPLALLHCPVKLFQRKGGGQGQCWETPGHGLSSCSAGRVAGPLCSAGWLRGGAGVGGSLLLKGLTIQLAVNQALLQGLGPAESGRKKQVCTPPVPEDS